MKDHWANRQFEEHLHISSVALADSPSSRYDPYIRFTEFKKLQPQKPSLICIGGGYCNTPLLALKAADLALNLLGRQPVGKPLPFQLIACGHGPEVSDYCGGKGMESMSHAEILRRRARTLNRSADVLFERILSPLIPDLRGIEDEAERARKTAKTGEDLRRLVFFCYSYGSEMLPFLHTKLCKSLKERGYAEEEIPRLVSEIKIVTMADLGLWRTQPGHGWHFTSLHFASGNDTRVQDESGIDPKQVEKTQQLFTLGEHANAALIYTKLPTQGWYTDAKNMTIRERRSGHWFATDRVLNPEAMFDDVGGHHPRSYTRLFVTNGGEGGQMMHRSLLQSGLRNAVRLACEGRECADPLKLLKKCEPFPQTEEEKQEFPYLPSLPAYDYDKRLAALKQNAAHSAHLPTPGDELTWQEIVSGQASAAFSGLDRG